MLDLELAISRAVVAPVAIDCNLDVMSEEEDHKAEMKTRLRHVREVKKYLDDLPKDPKMTLRFEEELGRFAPDEKRRGGSTMVESRSESTLNTLEISRPRTDTLLSLSYSVNTVL